MDNYFPIVIQIVDTGEYQFCKTEKQVPIGISFKVHHPPYHNNSWSCLDCQIRRLKKGKYWLL